MVRCGRPMRFVHRLPGRYRFGHGQRTNPMSKRDAQRQRALQRIGEHLLAKGLGQSSLRQLADAAAVSDRMLLYYFTDKEDVVAAALAHIVAALNAGLDQAIPAEPLLPPQILLQRATAIIAGPEMRPLMRLWVEIVGGAARGEAPYDRFAREISADFLQWIESRLAMPPGPPRAATAAFIFAAVDGLALVDICVGEDTVQAALGAVNAMFSGTDR